MTLIPVEHSRKLASPEEAARFFRRLDTVRFLDRFYARTVAVRGYHTEDPALVARLVSAVQPPRESTVSFEGGVLSREAQDSLSALALSPYEYLDVRTSDADLRVWPAEHSWVHASAPRSVVETVLGRPLAQGKNVVDDGELTLDEADPGHPVFLETRSIPRALSFFRAMTSETFSRGFVMQLSEQAKPALVAFLHALHPRVNVSMEIDLAAARSLTEAFPRATADWQSDGVMVSFPDGTISGFLTTPNVGERYRNRWLARVDEALRRAGLS